MEQQEPTPSRSEDALRRLEERLERASEAAERMIAEAAAAAAKPPPAGWQARGSSEAAQGELDVLMQFVNSLRELIPPELERRLADALRELLLAVRALIDWYLERSERRRTDPAEVQDIPIA